MRTRSPFSVSSFAAKPPLTPDPMTIASNLLVEAMFFPPNIRSETQRVQRLEACGDVGKVRRGRLIVLDVIMADAGAALQLEQRREVDRALAHRGHAAIG